MFMKKQFSVLLVLLSLSISVFTQKTADVSIKRLRTYVTYLASENLEGRRAGEKSVTTTAGYIANVFAQNKLKGGFQTANGKRSFMQPFPFVTGVEIAKTGNEFRLEQTKANGEKIKFQNLLPVKPVGFSPNGEVSDTEVIFVGFGIVSDDLKFDDYKDLNVTNKIVLLFDGTPENGTPNSKFLRFSDVRVKAKIAKDKGAKGVLVISRETVFENDKLTQLKYDQTLGESALPTIVISRNTAANMLGGNEANLSEIEASRSMTKDSNTKINLPIAPKNFNNTVAFKVNLVKKKAENYNVIGILEGTDSVLRNEAIVIGGHYDHLGRGGQGSLTPNSTDIHFGADDNASGTAGVLELAIQAAKARNNKRTLIFVAFGAEEEGLIGSNYYVNNPVFPLEQTVAMVNMDMIGRLREGKLTVGGIGTASEWNELVKRRNEFSSDKKDEIGLGKLFNLQLNEDGFGASDHSSFYGKKIPVLFFFTGTHEDYHKPSDTVDKINFDGLNSVITYVSKIVKSIDENPKRPTYAVAKSSGMGEGRRGFNVSLGTVPGYGESSNGMLVESVRDNSPAAKAGVKAGDKIVKLAGKEVRNVSDYTIILGELKPDIEYEIVVSRGNDKIMLKITPVARK
jgi:aminopeptidase YwaD